MLTFSNFRSIVSFDPSFWSEVKLTDSKSDNETFSNSDATEDSTEETESTVGENSSVNIPEYLHPEISDEGPGHMLLNQLGLIESLLPTYGLGKALALDKGSILDDADERISKEFQIPPALRSRVGFWFDVYTKYDSNHSIIHHTRFPWIIYRVVDVSMIIYSDSPSRLWQRRQRAELLVKSEKAKVRKILKSLAKGRGTSALTDEEASIASVLSQLDGSLTQNAKVAARDLRVQTGQRDFFIEGLSISSKYLPTMEKIFSRSRLPIELTRIPLVESSFNKAATSKVGASGIWQFMNGTGRKYMMVDGAIDERRSPFKATAAAARLLKENHLILRRSWPLAVTAWNHGPSGLRKAMAKSGSRELSEVIALYRSRTFDFASSNFYSEFLAALFAERYSDEVFGEIKKHPTEDLQAVKLSRSVRLNVLLRVSGMEIEEFLDFNPELALVAKKNLLIPRGFGLHMPLWALENLENLVAKFKTESNTDT